MRIYLDTSFGQILCRRAGEGPCLLLLHQTGRSSHMFLDLIEEMSRDFLVIAPDLPGSGGSDALAPDATIAHLADLVVQVLDEFGVRQADVYGIHSGNKLAAALAARHPDRVRRLAIAGQSHSLIPDRELRNRGIVDGNAGVQTVETGPLARMQALAETIRRLEDGGPDRLDDVGMVVALGRVADELQALAATPQAYRMNFANDFGADLVRLKQPALVIEIVTPQEDRLVGRQADVLKAILADATSVEILEADGRGLTLENNAKELAGLLRTFFTDKR